ncbi:LacI family DNA-binding transcriptional regulator [Hwangdonia lutea]|uniref:LacI family DNA-binding transcriptional regulator n=1 Tax=Hwangdonia lutea TaxID=3075823 RepID=A0AA97HQL6_9FLAO|nr:LacI family DNA-binding transcriptional regulator [Hwangdonia sp. SCSIO 19198]WOD42868.1 LacI family DNA-binding transcriptional regulator [Hwangdonia sp. SCSIO 19198]
MGGLLIMEINKVTIHDIARALNIDSSTVSRALNNSSRVTEKTKIKILEKAEELGYQRNALASNLRKRVTNTIGVVVPRISRHFFASVIQGVEETAYLAGYNVLICQSLEQLERETKITETLVANRVDGVLISISMETTNYNHMFRLKNSGIPLVFFDRHCNIPETNNVLIDDFKGGFDATQHLILKGCKHIVHFSGPQTLEIYKNRYEGYKAALKASNLPYKEEYVVSSRLMELDGTNNAKKLLKQKLVFDGIFSANDVAAIGAMKYLKENGVNIPKDVAMVGFSNEPTSTVINPTLTTIDQPGLEMGKVATKLLLKHIKNQKKQISPQTIIMDSKLIERQSSKK